MTEMGPLGRRLPGVEGEGRPWPRDDKALGDLPVRGPWIASGYMRITDRSKDAIKSGGYWISSIEIEYLAVGHPAVAEAAVIGVRHPKWDERPLSIVVCKPDAKVTREELLGYLGDKFAK
ncbi:MAG TPA: hypothetical protein VMB75_10470 [Rhodocyclaceae bacterium]|nr:hypothetical protein [Rhodocyclaceae bacterium]